MLNPEFGDLDLSLVLDDHFFSEPSNNEHEMSSNHNNTTSAMIIPPLTQQQLINPTTTTTTTTASINPFDYFAQQQQQLYHFQQQQQQQQQQITQQQQQVAAAAAVAFDAYMANQYNALSSLYSVQQQQQVPSFHPHQQQHHSLMNNTMYGLSPSMMILNNNNESSPSPTNSTTSSSSGSMGGEQQGLTDISDASNHSHHTPSPTTTSSTTTLSPRYHHHLHHQQECSESEDACGTTTARPSKRKKHKREPQEIDEDTREYERLSLIPNSQLSTEDKKRKKQLRNRLSAQQSRQRKNTLLQSALDENHELKKHNETLENDNRILKLRVKQLEDTNDHLEQKNKQLEKELKEYRVTDLMNTGSSSTPTHGTAVNDDDVMLEENVQDLFMRPLSPSHSGLMDHLFDFSGTSTTTTSSATMRSTTKMYMLVFLVACACIFFGFNTLLTRYDMNKRSANQLNHASPRMRLLQVNHSGPSGQVSPLPSPPESSSPSVSSSMNESYENIIVDSYVPRRRASAKRLPMEFNGHLMSEQKVYVPAELNQQYMTEEMLHSVIHHMDVDADSPNAMHEEKDEFVQDVLVDETNQQEEQPSELILTNNQQSKLALVERTNAKQLSLIPLALSTRDSNNFLFKHLKDDSYQQGYLYQLPDDSGSNQSNNTVRLFCPQIFPMITQTSTVEGGQNLSQTIEDAMSSKGCIKFVVPIGSEQFIDKDGIAVRVVRLAEISASDIKLTDSYLSLRSDEQPIVVPAEPLSSSGL